MSKSYFRDYDKRTQFKYPPWTWDENHLMMDILHEKGYAMTVVARRGCDGQSHDAWLVNRKDIPRLIEQLFRQRISVEVQAEGHGKATIIFVYDYAGGHILQVAKKLWKNNRED